MSDEDVRTSEQVPADHDRPNDEPVPASGQAQPEEPPAADGPVKTQGVRPARSDSGRRVLERAARAAARTGRRGDVHEYMRIRRGYL